MDNKEINNYSNIARKCVLEARTDIVSVVGRLIARQERKIAELETLCIFSPLARNTSHLSLETELFLVHSFNSE